MFKEICFHEALEGSEKEGKMLAKANFAPTLTSQYPANQPRENITARLHPAMKLAINAGQAILTVFAVFNGLPGSADELEAMGIGLGPSHA